MSQTQPTNPHSDTTLSITGSPGLPEWLVARNISLAFTTCQTSRLFFLGVNEKGHLSASERHYDYATGLCLRDDSLFLATRYQIWRFENVLEPGQRFKGHDRLYIPREAITTGDLDTHDLACGAQGELFFVNTRYNCVAAVSDRYSFRPVWMPPFISELAPGNRCHLNGLALRHGRPAYATCCSASDSVSGWRDDRERGGLLFDIPSSEVIVRGLSMPHSPRIFRNRLWLHNAGTGEFGVVDEHAGRFEPVAFCPGFTRGLDFVGNTAVIGVSQPHGETRFQGPLLDTRLSNGEAPFCGLLFVDLSTGAVAHWVRLDGIITDLFDVRVLDDSMHPMSMGFKTDEITHVITTKSKHESNVNIFLKTDHHS
ncbi:TIGR03032 family protein [Desulfoluna limicola]|uniref:TIGR03032 family protein n=1 Tax=Desulfoluna limicola TaxID=2810562 RepID=A0ABM7PEM7_9BACT|nr:TIGR03032 family protein [Desulfoluna limicola]BCS95689.1 TIGR03032 family protein [Desulfoluna limicola]